MATNKNTAGPIVWYILYVGSGKHMPWYILHVGSGKHIIGSILY